jgi:two-component system chemotaxis response regulator CheB
MKSKIRVLIVDDSLTIRAMIAALFERDDEIKVVGIAASAEEADEMLHHLAPDVITLDIKMPGMNGLEFLSYLKTWHDKPVIMLSSLSPRGAPERIEALKRGAVGSFNKANAIKDAPLLIKMIKDAAHGKLKADPEDAAALALVAAQQMGQFASLAA